MVLLVLAIVGMEWITRVTRNFFLSYSLFYFYARDQSYCCYYHDFYDQVQKLLLVLLICSQIDFVAGSFLDSDPYERAQVFFLK